MSINISLKDLNRDYPSLRLLTSREPKLAPNASAEDRKMAGKIVYRLGRIADAAEAQQEATNKTLQKLAKLHGITLGGQDNDPKKVDTFNDSAEVMLESNHFVCRWDAFTTDELSPYFDLTGDICKLGWLINDGSAGEDFKPVEPEISAMAPTAEQVQAASA